MRRGSTLPEPSISPFDGDLTKRGIGVFYTVYNERGYGLLEAVAMLLALNDQGIAARREVPIDIAFLSALISGTQRHPCALGAFRPGDDDLAVIAFPTGLKNAKDHKITHTFQRRPIIVFPNCAFVLFHVFEFQSSCAKLIFSFHGLL